MRLGINRLAADFNSAGFIKPQHAFIYAINFITFQIKPILIGFAALENLLQIFLVGFIGRQADRFFEPYLLYPSI